MFFSSSKFTVYIVERFSFKDRSTKVNSPEDKEKIPWACRYPSCRRDYSISPGLNGGKGDVFFRAAVRSGIEKKKTGMRFQDQSIGRVLAVVLSSHFLSGRDHVYGTDPKK